jgi:hypothetical protein
MGHPRVRLGADRLEKFARYLVKAFEKGRFRPTYA